MTDFSKRSLKKELLDRDDIPFKDIRKNMQELEFINARLGGHAVTVSGINKIIGSAAEANKNEILICEIGCGGGDNLAAICKWAEKHKFMISCIGIDINRNVWNMPFRKMHTYPSDLSQQIT